MLLSNTIHGFNGARLGNQIFQISLLYSIWKKTKAPFFQKNNGEMFFNCFDAEISQSGQITKTINYGCPFEFYPDLYTKMGTAFGGYFQNILYVESIRNDLINFLKFKSEHEDYSLNYISNIKKQYNLPIVGIHIRRGDYLLAEDILGNLTKSNYYNDAISSIKEEVCYLIFSDDITWCKNNFKLQNCEYVSTDEYKSLCMLTQMQYNIIANSTFSWWGAFLNKNSKTFIPSRWTGKKDYSDCGKLQNLTLNTWNRIGVDY